MATRKTSAARSKRADSQRNTSSHRAPRCTYSEDGRRCVKDGEGNPPLCRAHQIAVAEILNRKSRSPAQRVSDLVSDFLQGKRINQDEVMGVVQEVAQQWSGMAGDFRPPIDGSGRTDHHQNQRADQNWWTPRPGQGSRQAPSVDPQQEELRVARLRARRVLGFTTNQSISVDEVKHRQRTLAKKNHPDLGGSTQKMAAINAAADVLLADPDIR